MAASAGTLVLKDDKSGRTQTVDIYIPDAVATSIAFNGTGLAASTSPTTYRVPTDCWLVDITTAAAPTAVGGSVRIDSGVVSGGTFRWADRINTLSKRADMAIPIKAGSFLSILQH